MAELEKEEKEANAIWGVGGSRMGSRMGSNMSGRSTSLGSRAGSKHLPYKPGPQNNNHRKRVEVPQSAQDIKRMEVALRDKIYQKTNNVAKRSGLTMAYRCFTDGYDYPKV